MNMAIICTAKRLEGGQGHEHISLIWWRDSATNKEGYSTRASMVDFVEKHGNNSVFCPDRNPALKGAWVHVQSNGRIKYVQTFADGRKTDNLLSLPSR